MNECKQCERLLVSMDATVFTDFGLFCYSCNAQNEESVALNEARDRIAALEAKYEYEFKQHSVLRKELSDLEPIITKAGYGARAPFKDVLVSLITQRAELDALRQQVAALEYELSAHERALRDALTQRDKLRDELHDARNETTKAIGTAFFTRQTLDEVMAILRTVVREGSPEYTQARDLVDKVPDTAAHEDVLYSLVLTSVHEAGWPDDTRSWYELRDPNGAVYGAGYTPKAALEGLEFDFEAPVALDAALSNTTRAEPAAPITQVTDQHREEPTA